MHSFLGNILLAHFFSSSCPLVISSSQGYFMTCFSCVLTKIIHFRHVLPFQKLCSNIQYFFFFFFLLFFPLIFPFLLLTVLYKFKFLQEYIFGRRKCVCICLCVCVCNRYDKIMIYFKSL